MMPTRLIHGPARGPVSSGTCSSAAIASNMSVAQRSSSTTCHVARLAAAIAATSTTPLPTAVIGASVSSAGPSLMCSNGARTPKSFTTCAGSRAADFGPIRIDLGEYRRIEQAEQQRVRRFVADLVAEFPPMVVIPERHAAGADRFVERVQMICRFADRRPRRRSGLAAGTQRRAVLTPIASCASSNSDALIRFYERHNGRSIRPCRRRRHSA